MLTPNQEPFPIILSAPVILCRLDPHVLVDYGKHFLPEDQRGASGGDIDLTESGFEEAREAAHEILRPVHEALQSYLGLRATDELVYRDLNFKIARALPGTSLDPVSELWHSDLDLPDRCHVRADSTASSESLIGTFPQSFLRNVLETTEPITSLSREQLTHISDVLDQYDPEYGDTDLLAQGLTTFQPQPGEAYLLDITNLHRSPVNGGDYPLDRASFDIQYAALRSSR